MISYSLINDLLTYTEYDMNYEYYDEYELWCREMGLDPDEMCNWEMFLEEYFS